MANWQRHLKIGGVIREWQDGDITLADLAGIVHKKLLDLRPFDTEDIDDEREEIALDFKDISEAGTSATISEFDGAMERLYDWGDIKLDENWNGKKVCWIDTFAPSKATTPNNEKASAE